MAFSCQNALGEQSMCAETHLLQRSFWRITGRTKIQKIWRGDWHVWLREKLVPITTQTWLQTSVKKVLAFLFQPASTFENIIDRTSINSAEMLFLMPTLPRGERLLRADLWSLRMHWANCVWRSDELKLKQHHIGWSYWNMKDRIECRYIYNEYISQEWECSFGRFSLQRKSFHRFMIAFEKPLSPTSYSK